METSCSLRYAIIVPLMRRREVAGVLKLYQDRSRMLSAVDLELVRGLGSLISTQLELAELEKQSRLLADAEIKALHAQINPHFCSMRSIRLCLSSASGRSRRASC